MHFCARLLFPKYVRFLALYLLLIWFDRIPKRLGSCSLIILKVYSTEANI